MKLYFPPLEECVRVRGWSFPNYELAKKTPVQSFYC